MTSAQKMEQALFLQRQSPHGGDSKHDSKQMIHQEKDKVSRYITIFGLNGGTMRFSSSAFQSILVLKNAWVSIARSPPCDWTQPSRFAGFFVISCTQSNHNSSFHYLFTLLLLSAALASLIINFWPRTSSMYFIIILVMVNENL